MFHQKRPNQLCFPLINRVPLDNWVSSRAIICATNAFTDEINENVMSLLESDEEVVYKNCDSVKENEHQYPIEFINALLASGLPPPPH